MPLLIVLVVLVGLAYLALRSLRGVPPAVGGKGRARIVTAHLTDPREAAAILLFQQAAYEGSVSGERRDVVLALMRAQFEVEEEEADRLFSFARQAVEQTGDAAESLRRLLVPIREQCTFVEMKDLVAMLVQVGEASGPMTDRQRRLAEGVRRALSLPAPDQASA